MAFTKSFSQTAGSEGDPRQRRCPPPYWTVLQSSGGQPEEKVRQFGADTPLGRPGQPVEIAPLYVTLASDACSFTSGQVWCF
nr:Oxidoreductase [Raoultella sp. NCTC 9187]